MIKINVQKNLIGLEDLLIGTGLQEQERGPSGTAPVSITRINGSVLPYDETRSMKELVDQLQLQLDTLPNVVDADGNALIGLINSSTVDLNLPSRIWQKELSADRHGIYLGSVLMFEYNPVAGNIYIPGGTDFIAADNDIITAFNEADDNILTLVQDLANSVSNVQNLETGTAPNNLVQLTDEGKLPAIDGSLLTNLVTGSPIGSLMPVPYSTPDDNYMECAGQEVSRTEFSALFTKIGVTHGSGDNITTFNLPDYRGYFLRGWDNNRGIDPGRVLGSEQQDSIKQHNHDAGTLETDNSGNHTHGYQGGIVGGSNFNNGTSVGLGTTDPAGDHMHSINGNTGNTGGDETRPKNIAVMWQIKVR